jgi:ribosome-binding protein aMBF1 (putative translation factor)
MTKNRRRRPPRGKNADPNYISVTANIPKQLRQDLKDALAFSTLDTQATIERLLAAYVYGVLDVDLQALDVDALASHAKASQGRLLTLEPILGALQAQDGQDVLEHDLDHQDAQDAIKQALCKAPKPAQVLPVARGKQKRPQVLQDALEHDHAQALKLARHYLGYSQKQLAGFLGVSQKMVSFYEHSNPKPPKQVLDTVLGLLDDKQAQDAQDSQAPLLEVVM